MPGSEVSKSTALGHFSRELSPAEDAEFVPICFTLSTAPKSKVILLCSKNGVCAIFFCYIKLFPGWLPSFTHISLTPSSTLSTSWQLFNVNISALWRNSHQSQQFFKRQMHEPLKALWWWVRRTQHCTHRTKKCNILTSSLSVLCHQSYKFSLRGSPSFQNWQCSETHFYLWCSGGFAVLTLLQISALFGSTMDWGPLPELQNVFPGGDALS